MKIRFETLLIVVCGLLFFAGLAKANPSETPTKSPTKAVKQNADKFNGTWIYDDGRFGLSVNIKAVNGKLEGDYGNFSSKTSEGKILSSKIKGNVALIEVDCDWGGRGTVKITRLKGNKLHWKVIKRDESKGDFIVLVDRILTKK